jgi:tRNA A37 threonylcarbamoyladenosine dehydratase
MFYKLKITLANIRLHINMTSVKHLIKCNERKSYSLFSYFCIQIDNVEMGYDWNERTALLLGEERVEYLKNCHVLVVGLGGVGAYAAEMIARAGIGRMTIVDADTVNKSNINRQLPALHSSIGKLKVEVVAARLRDINPELQLTTLCEFVRDERTEALLDSASFNFVVDAIDSITPKTDLMYHTTMRKIPLISSMGAGAQIDPSQIKVADISKTFNCGLAKAVRQRLSKRGIKNGIATVFSTELPNKEAIVLIDNEQCKISTSGTVSYMPAMFGCYLASYVINNI